MNFIIETILKPVTPPTLRKKGSLFILFILMFVNGMAQDNFDQKLQSILRESVPLIRTDDLKDRIRQDQDIILLDTRSAEEFNISHIPNARFVEYKNFSPKLVEGLDRNKVVVVYCSVGYRSEKIGEQLSKLGFDKVYNLYGGIFDWKNRGNDVVNEKGNVTDSVHTYNKNWSQWLTEGIKVY